MGKSKQQLLNSIHNLAICHENLCTEFWVLYGEGEYDEALTLGVVTSNVAYRIKEINAELAVREAMGYA